ncbi:hypothetical protein [Litoreibacter halocynthiae]|nr:hypothetical protein [Litoreibacter halocynthiae]
MKALLIGLFAVLVIAPPAILAHQAGWRVTAWRPDAKQVLDRHAFGTLDYDEMTFALTAVPSPTYRATLRDRRKILFSKRTLHQDICNQVLTREHHAISAAPYSRFALMGLLARRAPITMHVSRSKNTLNPFMLLSIMSHRTENSPDPFVVELDSVEETLILHPDDRCENITPQNE